MTDKTPKTPKKTAPQGASVVVRSNADWAAVERDYRTSQMTLRELASKHGCSHGRIAQRAKAEGWNRDLSGAIKHATDAKLIEASVNSLLTNQANQATQELTNVVMAVAEVNTQVIVGHRTGLKRITSIKELLLSQIEQAAANMPDLAEVIEMLRSPDDNGMDKANDSMKKAMGRSALIDDLKKIAEVDERVRKGEREAFNIAPADSESPDSAKPKRIRLEFIDVESREL